MLKSKIELSGIPTLHSQWRLVHSRWFCVLHESVSGSYAAVIDLPQVSLADYLWSYGFNIPECIKYCVAESYSGYTLKFRQCGGVINIYINRLT